VKRYSRWRVGLYVLPIIFLCSVHTSGAWDQASEFHSTVNEFYRYEPQTLSAEAKQAKSDDLDTFWAYVKAKLPQRFPLLRAELRNPANSPFFLHSYRDNQKMPIS
jgi:hypothetical protein